MQRNMFFKKFCTFFLGFFLFTWKALSPDIKLQDQLPYPPQQKDFIRNNAPGFELIFDYIGDPDSERGARKTLFNATQDELISQATYVYNREKDIDFIKTEASRSRGNPNLAKILQSREKLFAANSFNYRWFFDAQNRYANEKDLEALFKFQSLGKENLVTVSAGFASNTLTSLKLLATDESNRILSWSNSGWSIISEETDHAHAADVAFIKVKHRRLNLTEAANRMLKENGKYASTGLVLGAPGVGIATGIMAIVGAATKYNFYELDYDNARFFSLDERKKFQKYATFAANDQVWIIGADQAPYSGVNIERYKHLTSKDPRSFYLSSEQRVFDIAAGDGSIAVLNETGVKFSSESEGLSLWNDTPALENSLVNKLSKEENKVAEVPGGAITICCGRSNQSLWAVSKNGSVYRLSSALDANQQKTWELVDTPAGQVILKASNASPVEDGTGKIILLTMQGELFLLVDGKHSIWRKLELLKPLASSQALLVDSNLKIRDASIASDGSICLISGAQAKGGRGFFCAADKVAQLGSPLGAINSKDLVTIAVGPKEFLALNKDSLVIRKFDNPLDVTTDQNCIFTIFRNGDIFALKAFNGKWLVTPDSSQNKVATILATGENSAMDASSGIESIKAIDENNMQFIALKIAEPKNPNIFSIVPIARNNQGFLQRQGNFVTSIDPNTGKPFKEAGLKIWITKVQDSSKFSVYLQVTESIEDITVRIGMLMQLLKNYMEDDIYSSEYFKNQDDLVFDTEKDSRTLAEILKVQWDGSIPALADEESALSAIALLENFIKQQQEANLQWSEDNSENIKNFMFALQTIFAKSDNVVKKITKLFDTLTEIGTFRTTDFKTKFTQIKETFDKMRKKFINTNIQVFFKHLDTFFDYRILGETAQSGETGACGIDTAVAWLIREAAISEFLSKGDATGLEVANKIKDVAEKFANPISINERLSKLEKMANMGSLLKDEKLEAVRQAKKILELNIIERLTSGEILRLDNIFEKLATNHNLKIEGADNLNTVSISQYLKLLRARINAHTDENGLWDSTKDGAIKNSLGIIVKYAAYTPTELFDDIDRIVAEIKKQQISQKLDMLAPEIKMPLLLSLQQLFDSTTKGKLAKEADFSEFNKKVNALYDQVSKDLK